MEFLENFTKLVVYNLSTNVPTYPYFILISSNVEMGIIPQCMVYIFTLAGVRKFAKLPDI